MTTEIVGIPTPTPSIGRVVHYHSYGTPGGEYLPEPRAAIITAVREEDITPDAEGPHLYEFHVSVCVLNPTGIFFTDDLPFSAEPKPGHWSWPPRV